MKTMNRLSLVVLAVALGCVVGALAGCGSMYQARIQTFSLRGGGASEPGQLGRLADTTAPSLTTYEQWTSLWSAVCGAVVSDSSGKVVQVVPGNCGTPLTLLLGSPINMGLATTAAAIVK